MCSFQLYSTKMSAVSAIAVMERKSTEGNKRNTTHVKGNDKQEGQSNVSLHDTSEIVKGSSDDVKSRKGPETRIPAAEKHSDNGNNVKTNNENCKSAVDLSPLQLSGAHSATRERKTKKMTPVRSSVVEKDIHNNDHNLSHQENASISEIVGKVDIPSPVISKNNTKWKKHFINSPGDRKKSTESDIIKPGNIKLDQTVKSSEQNIIKELKSRKKLAVVTGIKAISSHPFSEDSKTTKVTVPLISRTGDSETDKSLKKQKLKTDSAATEVKQSSPKVHTMFNGNGEVDLQTGLTVSFKHEKSCSDPTSKSEMNVNSMLEVNGQESSRGVDSGIYFAGEDLLENVESKAPFETGSKTNETEFVSSPEVVQSSVDPNFNLKSCFPSKRRTHAVRCTVPKTSKLDHLYELKKDNAFSTLQQKKKSVTFNLPQSTVESAPEQNEYLFTKAVESLDTGRLDISKSFPGNGDVICEIVDINSSEDKGMINPLMEGMKQVSDLSGSESFILIVEETHDVHKPIFGSTASVAPLLKNVTTSQSFVPSVNSDGKVISTAVNSVTNAVPQNTDVVSESSKKDQKEPKRKKKAKPDCNKERVDIDVIDTTLALVGEDLNMFIEESANPDIDVNSGDTSTENLTNGTQKQSSKKRLKPVGPNTKKNAQDVNLSIDLSSSGLTSSEPVPLQKGGESESSAYNLSSQACTESEILAKAKTPARRGRKRRSLTLTGESDLNASIASSVGADEFKDGANANKSGSTRLKRQKKSALLLTGEPDFDASIVSSIGADEFNDGVNVNRSVSARLKRQKKAAETSDIIVTKTNEVSVANRSVTSEPSDGSEVLNTLKRKPSSLLPKEHSSDIEGPLSKLNDSFTLYRKTIRKQKKHTKISINNNSIDSTLGEQNDQVKISFPKLDQNAIQPSEELINKYNIRCCSVRVKNLTYIDIKKYTRSALKRQKTRRRKTSLSKETVMKQYPDTSDEEDWLGWNAMITDIEDKDYQVVTFLDGPKVIQNTVFYDTFHVESIVDRTKSTCTLDLDNSSYQYAVDSLTSSQYPSWNRVYHPSKKTK